MDNRNEIASNLGERPADAWADLERVEMEVDHPENFVGVETPVQQQEALAAEQENTMPKLEFVREAMRVSQEEIAKQTMARVDEITAQKDFSPLELVTEYVKMSGTMRRGFPDQGGLNAT